MNKFRKTKNNWKKLTAKEKKYNEQSNSIRQKGNNNNDFNYKKPNTVETISKLKKR